MRTTQIFRSRLRRSQYINMIWFYFRRELSISVLLVDQLKLNMQKWAPNLMVPRVPCGVNPALLVCQKPAFNASVLLYITPFSNTHDHFCPPNS